MPRLYDSFSVTGNLKKEVARELGFPESVRIIAGAGDNAAAALGTGIAGNGSCNISLGTSGTVFVSASDYQNNTNHAVHLFRHADGGYHFRGCMLSAASCNKWWLEEILKTADYSGELKAEERLGDNDVYFLPYLMGERSPHNNPDAKGAFIGLRMDTTRAEMTQSVLEGVAFGLRDSMEAVRSCGIDPTRSYICGGGSKSRLWVRILVNVMNMTMDIPLSEEGPSLGGAVLAAVGCGAYPNVASAVRQICKIKESMEPDPELVKKYESRYQKWRRFYPALEDTF